MRVLILSCNTGEGHNSGAKAIQEVSDARGDVCEIKDSLTFISDRFSKFISWGHSTMYRHLPGLFKVGYTYSEKHPAVFHEDSGIYKLLTSGTERLYAYLTEGAYDTVICVHVFSALLLTAALKAHPMPLKTAFVATDYTCSPIVRESRLDRYFIPDASIAYEFEFPNIPRENIVGSGIPIRQAFYRKSDKSEAKARFGIGETHSHLLMMCGSMGCGPMGRLADILSDGIGPESEITIVCGTNEKLRQKLEKKFRERTDVHVLGFVKDMSALMDSADLYLTKPGGLSVSEAAVKNLPMVYIDAVAGCEEYNRRHFVRMGGAKTGANVKEVADTCLQLLRDKAICGEMEAVLAAQKLPNASQTIYDTMAALPERTEA